MKEILTTDAVLMKERVKEIKQELKDLAGEFRQTLGESSETWHDNSPWDNAKAKEAVLIAELEKLEYILKTHTVVEPSPKNTVGANHVVNFNGKKVKIFLAGDFSLMAGQKIDDYIVVTKDSPIAQELFRS